MKPYLIVFPLLLLFSFTFFVDDHQVVQNDNETDLFIQFDTVNFNAPGKSSFPIITVQGNGFHYELFNP